MSLFVSSICISRFCVVANVVRPAMAMVVRRDIFHIFIFFRDSCVSFVTSCFVVYPGMQCNGVCSHLSTPVCCHLLACEDNSYITDPHNLQGTLT